MIKNYFKKLLLSVVAVNSLVSYAQTKKDLEYIKKHTNVSALKQLSKDFLKESQESKKKALKLAKEKGWKIKGTNENGSYFELMSVTKEGFPIYYQTDSAKSARSTRANTLHTGGILDLDVNGEDMIVHVWDGGHARVSHNEFKIGDTQNSNVSVKDTESFELLYHSAHVIGIIVANGFDPDAKGMAPKAKCKSYEWTNDLSEIASEASEGMLLSNHSYGQTIQSASSNLIGTYGVISKNIDQITHNAPYYLPIFSAGNNGDNDTINNNPLDGESSFDKLGAYKVAKNNLTVANLADAYVDNDGTLINTYLNPFSSQGPSDDYRIKPEISANGTTVYSTGEKADNHYIVKTGTSMSAPNATGTLLLLQQHYKNINNTFMRAATLKGLALHTADDIEEEGPNATTGWGLLNAKFAAETISNETSIQELTLNNNETYSQSINVSSGKTLKVSISWTDLPGIPTEELNLNTPALVNNLDLVVLQNNTEFKPWKLTGVKTNAKGNNNVDPFERVDIKNASGEYTINVTHKGELINPQNYSLIVTVTNPPEEIPDCTEFINIPDANFKAALLAHGNTITGNHIFKIDTNDDGEICEDEAKAYLGYIKVDGKNIYNLTGLEAFTNVTRLECSDNQLQSLDISNNTELNNLYISDNTIENLDTSNNKYLLKAYCNNNKIKNIDLGINKMLTNASFDENELVTANVSNGTNLYMDFLDIRLNPNLMCIQHDEGFNPEINSNWDKDDSAEWNTDCQIVSTDVVYDNTINIYPNPAHDFVTISWSDTTNVEIIEIFTLTGKKLLKKNVTGNKTKLNITNLPSGSYIIKVGDSNKKLLVK